MNKPFHLTLLAATLSMAAFTATAAETQVVAADATTNEAEEAKSSRFFGLFETKAAPVLRYPVRVESDNKDLKALVETHLPLITQQEEEELDREQAAFLAEDAPAQATTMLETQG